MNRAVTLDEFEYELTPIVGKDGKVYHQLIIILDDLRDPSLADIFGEISKSSNIHVDGRYFVCLGTDVSEDVCTNRIKIRLVLDEIDTKEGSKNEVS